MKIIIIALIGLIVYFIYCAAASKISSFLEKILDKREEKIKNKE
ncbi:MAG: hypothetical protein Athens101410_92 [Parcubacteria group bacterium Athens1014_10]|nr:MAG: hypothetical protein Athens101410_92 [Parcubacteria group bacterium Athens1014_10]TSD05938.1 MAG: hypothetical protein Athens071412_220 [Parcubacteria group bacterium Athens0714_12]